ncbi:hypothetical protein H4J57_19525 [Colwellia sp. BRX8-7]|uniref:HTH-like domain-containing protein n=1 Tax=Colwellia sp. BRX8-7 TaxID=2759833 RepID=UPI0015F5A6C5|nr:hypothetical protein [Colwellia sp. BRX8-7]MBA6339378.1 hypothetical protein [Colwellia sp. BRX8-7]
MSIKDELTVVELGRILKDKYHTAPKGEAVAMIHLFGITYAEHIKATGASMRALILAANIPKSYATEISKGVKLAAFVSIK